MPVMVARWGIDPASPSSRRAWIEIFFESCHNKINLVALLAEGVDRNKYEELEQMAQASRPPRGGRG